jgi:hypothetical protein
VAGAPGMKAGKDAPRHDAGAHPGAAMLSGMVNIAVFAAF